MRKLSATKKQLLFASTPKKDRVFGFSVQEQKIHERLLNDEASTKEFKDRYLRV